MHRKRKALKKDFSEQREAILKVTGKLDERVCGLFGAARAEAKLALILPSRDEKPQILPAKFAEIAQLVEHDLAKVGVASSSLVFRSVKCSKADFLEQREQCQTCLSIAESRQKAAIFGTKIAEIAQLVEHDLAKVGVASSSLVFRSNK